MQLHLHAPIGGTGYGNVSINLIKQLYNSKHDIYLTSIGQPRPENQLDANIISECIEKQQYVPYDCKTVKIWHQFDLLCKPGNGKYYAYPFFEIDSFTDLEKHHLKFPDELIVSSSWAKNIVIQNGIEKTINIVPLGVDENIFRPIEQNDKKTMPNYIFITIGKWEIRKSHDIVIECFNKAFEHNDNVELWMVTHNPFLSKEQEYEWISLVQNSKLKNKIKIFPRLPTQEDIAKIISYADCGVYISRAEGWNLELLETMAMNKPVIATNYSAHTEYCNSNNSFMVNIDNIEPAIDNKWFHGFGNWAKIEDSQKNQVIEYMRKAYKNRITTNPEGVNTSKQYTWQNSADTMVRCIDK